MGLEGSFFFKKKKTKEEKLLHSLFSSSSSFLLHCLEQKPLVRSSKITIQQKVNAEATESALISPFFKKPAFNESILNVSTIPPKLFLYKNFPSQPFLFGNLVTIVSVSC